MAKKTLPSSSTGPFNSPFASLAAKASELPPGPPRSSEAPKPAPPRGPPRAVVRYERKGHGGKEMTRVEQLGLRPQELERWLKDIKQGLGCGGGVEGDTLLVQGDQRERLRAFLERQGVLKVTVS